MSADCGSFHIAVRRARADLDAVAELTSIYGSGTAEWADLPLLGEAPVARVTVNGEGMHLHGWASLGDVSFRLRRRVDLVAQHVWIRSDSPVAILGTSGDRVAIAVETPFAAPKVMETLVGCDLFAAHGAGDGAGEARLETASRSVVPTARVVHVHDAPGGTSVLTFVPSVGARFDLLEERDGSYRIAGASQALSFDGWIGVDEGEPVERIVDRDFGDCLDQTDSCPSVVTLRDAPVWVGVGPGGEAMGSVDRGRAVILGERRDGFVAFTMENRVIGPVGGRRFWVRESDVGGASECGE